MPETITGLFTIRNPSGYLRRLSETAVPGFDGQGAAIFLTGYDAAFAIALHLKTGWPIHIFEQSVGHRVHAFCVKPHSSGPCYADVRGVSDKLYTFLADIAGQPTGAFSLAQINDITRFMDKEARRIGSDTLANAIVLADRYIEAHPDYYRYE